jgi:hypothetical protein
LKVKPNFKHTHEDFIIHQKWIWTFPKILVTPKSPILVKKSIINHPDPFGGTPFMEISIWKIMEPTKVGPPR